LFSNIRGPYRLRERYKVMKRILGYLLCGWIAGVLCLADDVPQAWKDDFRSLSAQLAWPIMAPAEAGCAWEIELEGVIDSGAGIEALVKEINLLALWDAQGRVFFRLKTDFTGELILASEDTGSRFIMQKHQKTFKDSQPLKMTQFSLFTNAVQYLVALNASKLALWPEEVDVQQLEGQKNWSITTQGGKDQLSIRGILDSFPTVLKLTGRHSASFTIKRWGGNQEACQRLTSLLKENPSLGVEVNVNEGQLSEMANATLDFLEERVYSEVAPSLLPDLMKGVERVDGRPLIVVKGTPQEMGKSYAEQLRQITIYNCRKILFAFGVYHAIEKGEWFPHSLLQAFELQKAWLPAHYIEEMDALADELQIPREYIYAANIFPEFFHCSVMAFKGKATEDGQLLHGRILDYMTEIGLQRAAVTVVFMPTDRTAWVNIGYAGCVGTVTCMNEKGLAFGMMGGRGEGYLEGIPMTFLMREVAERFETTADAVEWIKSVPRSCEYFYVLSDAKTHGAVAIASWSAALAKEKGLEQDILVLHPGEKIDILPKAIEDTCFVASSHYYTTLADRIEAHHGKINPEVAWQIMGEGVARTSALHIVLFMPDTLDFWTAESSVNGRPAYTQPVHKMNLKRLIENNK